jgi:uncharacterized protein (TIGR03435 family)
MTAVTLVTLISGAVLNTFWQTVILAFLIWLSLKLLQPRLNAATRHIVWWITLAAVVALPCLPRRSPRIAEQQPSARTVAALPARVSAPLAPQVLAPVTVTERRSANWPPWVLAIWAAVFAYQTIQILRSYIHVRGVKQRARISMRKPPGLPRPARLLLSAEIGSPIAVGFRHPAVILPEDLCEQLTDEELNDVLLHEFAHLARYDDWLNLIARLLSAAFVLHPVVWWILRQMEREREISCDDWVVARTGKARSYAGSLARIAELRIAELRVQPADLVLTSGIFSSRSRLRARIEMLLQRGREFSPIAARKPLGIAASVLVILAIAGSLAPRWIVFAQRPEFEVASVKRNTTNGPGDLNPRRSGDLVTMNNTQVFTVLFYAYNLNGTYQVVGFNRLPDGWNWYDIQARAKAGATDEQIRLMFQSLLEDRFKLKIHRETRDIPEYELTIAKAKAKLTPARDVAMTLTIEGKTLKPRPDTCMTSLWHEGNHFVCRAAGMDKIVTNLSGLLRAPVVDRTGLTGTYDFDLLYIPDERRLKDDAPPGPTLEQAVQEDLGLKLEKGKGPVEVIVVDHLEKPSEN